MRRFILGPTFIATLLLAACGSDSNDPTPSPSPRATIRDVTPPELTVEDRAWYCVDAWGALSNEQANRYYGGIRPERGAAAVPERILDRIDEYCFDGDPPD